MGTRVTATPPKSAPTATMAPILGVFFALISFLAIGNAHNIQMRAHSRECFHESLHKDDKMTVTFQVGDREFGGSGNLDIDFWIENPRGGHEIEQRSVSSGDYSFDAKHDGRYMYCFSNEHWSANSKEVRQLTELLAQVKDEQGYIVIRERTHRNTAESTNARVKWWSIFQMGVLLGQGAFQIWWLRRFFEVKDPSRPSFNKGALG